MTGRRAATLLELMSVIEGFTLQRVWRGLSDAELTWKPIEPAWGICRREECSTPTPFGEGDWVADCDFDVMVAAINGRGTEPMTTIGWLMWHVASVPGRVAQLDFLGGDRQASSGWTSPYLTHHPVFGQAAPAVGAMQAGWAALREALEGAEDEQLEAPVRSYGYGPGRPAGGLFQAGDAGPAIPAVTVVVGALNEVSHHGAQMCALRDLYRASA